MRLAMIDKTDSLTEDERARLRQRLRFLLTRFTGEVRSVRLVASSSETSSTDVFVCRGTVTMRDGEQREAEDQSDELMNSATRVVDRLGRAVARQVECEQPSGRRVARLQKQGKKRP